MAAVLILFAHPALEKSRVHTQLLKAARGISGVTFHDLYETYPDFDIDVREEQELLLQHDVVIWQHPFYWYSAPAIIKQWEDLVLEHGWAYGSGGRQLAGKAIFNAVTCGGSGSLYAGWSQPFHRSAIAGTVRSDRIFMWHAVPAAICGTWHTPPPEKRNRSLCHSVPATAAGSCGGPHQRTGLAKRYVFE
jgi:putative NADPH-quinone reductase